jgi:mono/diheme cytochrome c family protein
LLLSAGGGLILHLFSSTPDAPLTGHGEAATLRAVLERWQKRQATRSVPEILTVLLRPWRALGFSSKVQGLLRLNLLNGSLEVTAEGLPAAALFTLWLVDNRPGPGRSVHPEEGDVVRKIGDFGASAEGRASFRTVLPREALAGFELDLAVIAPRESGPWRGLLFGSPNLLQRLAFGGKPWSQSAFPPAAFPDPSPPAFAFLLPPVALAEEVGRNTEQDLERLIARGRQIFVEETFAGNGRTCATCHRPDNNHTIDPRYIARLPQHDPLFVAEYDPNLAELEHPALLRQLGLILANVDGFDRPGVLRSVPHLNALATSITTEICKEHGGQGDFCADDGFVNALGWSGDGAPGSGSLREFALGAIAQHFPKTLNRVPGVDFRLPTDEELTALEAYLLSLGRSQDPNLADLTFTSPIVERGKLLFDTKQNPVRDGKVVLGETANCNGCHQNAGGNSSTTAANPTRDTGVENQRDLPAQLLDATAPLDGGFGRDERHNCGAHFDQLCFGDGRFNTPPLIEAADTAPFFHNHSVNTLEEAIAFYATDAFNQSPGSVTSSGADRRVKLDSAQVVAIALFLRTLNALENIRSANALLKQALKQRQKSARETLRLALAETEDAIEVLREAMVFPYPEALARLERAREKERQALRLGFALLRNPMIQAAIELQREARSLMVVERRGDE